MNKEGLISFEMSISDLFLGKKIRFPVHLSGGNEDKLIEIFKEIRKEDWVFSTHRNHYHALLKGIKPEDLRNYIKLNGSMHVYFKKFFTSGIVGGVIPIALGVAMGIKRDGGSEKVWVFVGDMAGYTGIFAECVRYAGGHDLPIKFIVEDNGLSVETPTHKVWGQSGVATINRYEYNRQCSHQGCGKWIEF